MGSAQTRGVSRAERKSHSDKAYSYRSSFAQERRSRDEGRLSLEAFEHDGETSPRSSRSSVLGTAMARNSSETATSAELTAFCYQASNTPQHALCLETSTCMGMCRHACTAGRAAYLVQAAVG